MKRKQTRLTIVKDEKRICEFWDVEIQEEVQDSGRTLKIFLRDKK